jgi:hypothetical protein
MAEANAAALIADHHKGRKAKTPSALHHFGDAVDMHELIDELAFAVSAFTLAGFTCHGNSFPFLGPLCGPWPF